MLVSDFDFDLPQELIAQRPLEDRAAAKMLVMEREGGRRATSDFHHFAEYLQPGDCLVLNDTRVIPARLWGTRPESGGRVQVFMLESRGGRRWQAFLKPGRRLRVGARVVLDGAGSGLTVLEKSPDGACLVEFDDGDTGFVKPGAGRTSIFLYPPKTVKVTDGLLTNFHLPQSTLLMLVCCLAPYDQVMSAYRQAVQERYRFFSYGDCMLLLPPGRTLHG